MVAVCTDIPPLAFSAIYTEVFFFFFHTISINVCTVSLGYFYFVGEKEI